jgi:hypothetical protein
VNENEDPNYEGKYSSDSSYFIVIQIRIQPLSLEDADQDCDEEDKSEAKKPSSTSQRKKQNVRHNRLQLEMELSKPPKLRTPNKPIPKRGGVPTPSYNLSTIFQKPDGTWYRGEWKVVSSSSGQIQI